MPPASRCAALAALFALTLAAPAAAAVLLPGDILVSGRDQILRIDPDQRRPPEVVSSPTVGSGAPFPRIEDFALAPDGILYAIDSADTVLRIDPATGDRTVFSSNTVGQGERLSRLSAIEVARDGLVYVADTWGISSTKPVRIYWIHPAAGDRILRAEATLVHSINWRISDLRELPDGRLAVTFLVGFDENQVWIANLGLGSLLPSSAPFEGSAYSLAVAASGDSVFVVNDAFGVPSGIFEVPLLLSPGEPGPVRQVSSCGDPQPAFSLRPLGLALDASGFLIVAASNADANCTLPGLRRLAGQVYRVDPATGESTLLYESEPVLDSAGFSDVLVVPEDFPFDDADADGVADVLDNCPLAVNAGQDDSDADGVGDACNDAEDPDGDEIADLLDVCPDTPDPLQLDQDGDRVGDACDPFPADPNNAAAALEIDLAAAREDLAICLDQVPGDSDEDGRPDPDDRCPETAWGMEVDAAGCSLAQFCEEAMLGSHPRRACVRADWRNDEPVRPADCRVDRGRCVPR